MAFQHQPHQRRRFRLPGLRGWLIIFGVLFVLLMVGLSFMFGGTEQQQQGGMAMAVEGATATSETFTDSVKAVGTLLANEGIILRPEVSGKVVEINFKEGQKVEAGAVLIRLSGSEEQADMALAQQNFARAKSLAGRGAGTERSLDEASAGLASAQSRLDKKTLKAPFAGTVGIRQVSLGDYVSPGQDLVSLQDLSSLKLDFRLPEKLLSQVAVGQPVRITVASFPGSTFGGEVTAIDPLVDPNARSVSVRAVVPNDDEWLRPGLFAEVQLVLKEKPNTVFIPSSSIWPVGNDTFVFKVTDGVANMVPVKVASQQGDRVALAEGLSAGDVVVSAGQVKLVMGPPGTPVPVALTNMQTDKTADKTTAPEKAQ